MQLDVVYFVYMFLRGCTFSCTFFNLSSTDLLEIFATLYCQ